MLMSMTGFGKAVAESPTKKITVEIKSLNSKQLDLSVRIPAAFRERELEVRGEIGRVLERGKVDCVISSEALPGIEAPLATTLNVEALKAYKEQITAASKTLGIAEPTDWYSVLLRFPDSVHSVTPETADDADASALMSAVSQAIAALMAHRRTEGEALERFFAERIEAIGELLARIDPYEKERIEKIRSRIEEGLAKIPVAEYDKGRLEQEMIFYLEKLDINEEKVRLRQHCKYFMDTIDSEPYPGKKLGFIIQEMGREINTTGSKANHADIQQLVVKMKDELEKMREQSMNVL